MSRTEYDRQTRSPPYGWALLACCAIVMGTLAWLEVLLTLMGV